MPLATWIREKDEALFAQFTEPHPEIAVQNGRTREVDLAEVRGLLVTGGPDISAEFHVEPVADLEKIQDPEPERDAWEFTAIRHALEHGLPLLCICKGHQVLNVALGGTLHLDIRGHDLPEMRSENVQPLRYGAVLPNATGLRWSTAPIIKPSIKSATALKSRSLARGDDVIEQVRLKNFPWGRGVQYHPERDFIYRSLFEDFFAQLNYK